MSSLIAAYTFNESAAHDFSGNKYHLTNNSVTFSATTSSAFGMDAVFTSGSSKLSGVWPSLASLTAFSCFMNIYGTTPPAVMAEVSGAFVIGFSGGKPVFTVSTNSNEYTLTSSTVLSSATWYTLGFVWDGTNIYIYINGALDSSLAAAGTNMAAGAGTLIIGDEEFTGLLNMIEFRNIALQAQDIYNLNASPGGTLYEVGTHNFSVGDLIADPTVTYTGVVTWVVDQSNFYAYPFVIASLGALAKYGNIYNTLRQSIMEISNDFDGNGNSQISIKYPIASFADYASPANIITFDYRGLSGSPDSIGNAMAITSLRI
ncbi:MAG: LamG-like jellyroll fold domain-containing protein [Bacteroidia bacterium]